MLQRRFLAISILLIGAGVAWWVYSTQHTGTKPFKLGLDLSGGTQLVYRANLSNIAGGDVADSMASLRDTIERRVNLFGVSEPIVQTEKASSLSGTSEQRLIVELPGVTDTQKAIALMQENKAGCLVVEAQKKVEGIFTETDVVQKILETNADWSRPVREFMTPNPIVLTAENSVGEAIQIMGENRIYHIPLVNAKQELAGLLSVRSLIRFLAEFYPTEVYNLPPKPNQLMETAEGG